MVRWFVGGAELVCSGDARAGGESGSLWLFGEGGRAGEGGDWSIGGRMMGMGWVGRAGREGRGIIGGYIVREGPRWEARGVIV